MSNKGRYVEKRYLKLSPVLPFAISVRSYLLCDLRRDWVIGIRLEVVEPGVGRSQEILDAIS